MLGHKTHEIITFYFALLTLLEATHPQLCFPAQVQASPVRDTLTPLQNPWDRGAVREHSRTAQPSRSRAPWPQQEVKKFHFSYHVGRKRNFGEELLEELARLHLGSFQVLLLLLKQEEGTGDIGDLTHRPGNSLSSAYSNLLNPGSSFSKWERSYSL